MAGDSAREAARHAERLSTAPERVAQRGAADAAVAAALRSLEDDGWEIFRDVHWPGRSQTRIALLAVGPGGVFAIDARHWAGEVSVRSGALCHDGHRREHEVAQAAEDALEVTSRLAGYPATPVLCFVGQPGLNGWARDVLVTSVLDVAQALRERPVVFDADQVEVVAGMLRSVVRVAAGGTPATPADRTVESSFPARRNGSPRVRGAIGALLGLVAVLVLLHYLPAIDQHLTNDGPRVAKLGNAVTAPGTTSTPRVRAIAVVTRDDEINGRVEVRFTLRDLGGTSLYLGNLWAQISDNQNRIDGWRPTGGLALASVQPGHQRSVLAHFVLPAGDAQVEHVTLRVSGRADTLITWSTH